MRTRALLAALAALTMLLVGTPPPAAALAGAGVADVACRAYFPQVPATSWRDDGTCFGSATVYATGVDNNGLPWSVGGSGWFGAWFEYHEPCLAGPQPGVFVSFASGVFEIRGLPGSYGGFGTTATVWGWFDWDRVGMNPVIRIYDLHVEFQWAGTIYPFPTPIWPPVSGAGTAAFTNLGTFDSNRHFLCQQGGGPLELDIAMAAAVQLV